MLPLVVHNHCSVLKPRRLYHSNGYHLLTACRILFVNAIKILPASFSMLFLSALLSFFKLFA